MCLEELMHSDEDMLGLLLTETKELGQGEVTPTVGLGTGWSWDWDWARRGCFETKAEGNV